jgi:hypothetical protein
VRPGAARLAARAADLAVPLALAAFGWSRPDDVLWGGLAWLGAVLIALAGWGALVERAVKASVDLGLRMAWGVVALLAVAGAILAARVLTQPVVLALLAVGYGGYAWRRLTAAEPVAIELLRGARALADDPQRSIAWGLLAALAAINVLLAVARTYGNPFDDDVAYLPLIQRLLDVGDLDEPFSFRRLSALGGQTVLGGLTAARGTLLNLYAIDHGAGQLITWALLIGLVRGQPRREPAIVALVALVVVLLPDASTNTASHWTGAALFPRAVSNRGGAAEPRPARTDRPRRHRRGDRDPAPELLARRGADAGAGAGGAPRAARSARRGAASGRRGRALCSAGWWS